MHPRQGALVWRVPDLGPAEHVVNADSGIVENLWPGAAVEGSYATLGWRTRSRVQIAIFRLILKPYAVQPPDPDNIIATDTKALQGEKARGLWYYHCTGVAIATELQFDL